jgi:cytochrome P450
MGKPRSSRRKTTQPFFTKCFRVISHHKKKEVQRLGDEAENFLGAGLETTTWALTIATFHILGSPSILKRLCQELKEAIPGPYDELDWQRPENLLYLTACIQEALRLSYGVTARHPRVSNQAAMQYKEWSIPPRAPASMSTMRVRLGGGFFPGSRRCVHERWPENPQNLNRFLVSFGKDARSCLGIKYVIPQEEFEFR